MSAGVRRCAAPGRSGRARATAARGLCRVVALLALVLAALPALADAPWSTRDFDHPEVGRIQVRVPADWIAYERQDGAGTTFVRLVPPGDRFGLEIQINARDRLKLSTLTDAGLEAYLVESLSGLLPRFLEAAVAPVRFGPAGDGVYARLTDRRPRQGEFLFLTRGLRLIGDTVIVFTLYSSDHDASVLTTVLAVVSGTTITPR